jgi:hypothetical protein
VRGYRSQLTACCAEHDVDARTAIADDLKRYREDLVGQGRQYTYTTIAHKLNVLRRVYAAAVAADQEQVQPGLARAQATGLALERPRLLAHQQVANQFRDWSRERRAPTGVGFSKTRATVSTKTCMSKGLERKPTKAAFLLRSLTRIWASANSLV